MPRSLKRLANLLVALFALSWPESATAAATSACDLTLTAPKFVKMVVKLGDVLIDDACKYLYLTNQTDGAVEVFSLEKQQFEMSIPVGKAPMGMDTSPDGKLLYVANSELSDSTSTISVIDTSKRAEIARITIPSMPSSKYNLPTTIAVAETGQLFVTTKESGAIFLRYDPRDGTFFEVPGVLVTERSRTVASGDRKVIAVAQGGSSGGLLFRYVVAAGTVSLPKETGNFLFDVALDATGARIMAGARIMDAKLSTLGTPLVFGIRGVFAAKGDVAYQLTRTGMISAFDLRSLVPFATLSLGDATKRAENAGSEGVGRMSLSRDGTVLAVITDNGFSLIGAGDALLPSTRFMAFSSAQNDQSLFRVYNGGATPGVVSLSIADFTSGRAIADWTSSEIAPGVSRQIHIGEIEAAAATAFEKPTNYILTVRSRMKGTIAHVVFNAKSAIISNLSVCDAPSVGGTAFATNVHGKPLDTQFASSIAVVNSGPRAASATLLITDASTGAVVGRYTSPALAAGTGRVLLAQTIFAAANMPASTQAYYYNIQADNRFSGFIQHFVRNPSGVISDMSRACPLPGPSP